MISKDFIYPLESDSDIFRSGTITLDKTDITIQAATVAGSKDGIKRKSNEDAFSIVKDAASVKIAVFDGSSSQKPIPSLKESGARFASHFLKQEFESEHSGRSVREIIRKMNNALLKKNLQFEGANLDDINSMPASTTTLADINGTDRTLGISHVGDTFCMVLFKDGHTKLVTIDKNKKYDDEILQVVGTIAKEKNITPREAKKDPRIAKMIADMFQATHNKPDGTGQGVMNGDPNVEKYIQDISFPLAGIKSILLGSDGLIPPGWDETQSEYQQKFFEVAEKDGIRGLIHIKQETENNDPDWYLLRYKHSDDATGIYVKLA